MVESAQLPETVEDGADRRRAPRIKRESTAQLMFWPSSTRTLPIDVKLVDYSQTGVGVLHNEAMIVGQRFVLREPFVTRESTCLYTVARCQKRGDGYFIIGLHAIEADVITPTPDVPAPAPRWIVFSYFLYALVGAILIVAMALLHH